MVKYIGYLMFGIGVAALFTVAFIDINSSADVTANVIASNSSAFTYLEAALFSIAAVSLVMGTVFLKNSKQN